MITAPERSEEQTISEPRIRARGHLALVNCEETTQSSTLATNKKSSNPIRRSVLDRLYENSIIMLLAVTIIAIIASLSHL